MALHALPTRGFGERRRGAQETQEIQRFSMHFMAILIRCASIGLILKDRVL